MRWAGNVARTGDRRLIYRALVGGVGGPEGKRPLGRPSRRCRDNFKMYLKEIEWMGVE